MYTIANEGLHRLRWVILGCLHLHGYSFRWSNILSSKTNSSWVFSLLIVCWAASLKLPDIMLKYGYQIHCNLIPAVSEATWASN